MARLVGADSTRHNLAMRGLITLFLLSRVASIGQEVTGTIAGNILDAAGSPVAGATIRVRSGL